MPRWTLAPEGDHLLRDRQPAVVVADTVWAALHRAEPERFRALLERRAEQGFNTIMMTLLPIAHDASGRIDLPFEEGDDGSPDFSRLDPAWLSGAVAMVDEVVAHGLTPMLMLQWVDFVPDSWASVHAPQNTMTDDQARAFVAQAVPAFKHAAPLWSLSGDDTFTGAHSVPRHLQTAAQIRELDPEGLITAHTGAWINFPVDLLKAVDFIGYQSSHGYDWDVKPQQWNGYLAALPRRVPTMNLEPCYEGHGYGSGSGRYTARDVRTASWRSMLTGAGSGIAYGAHGVWSWHHTGQPFAGEGYSSTPFDVEVAATFPGAADIGWLGEMAGEYRFWELIDRPDLLFQDSSGATAGATMDTGRVVVHAPHAISFKLELPFDAYEVDGFDIVAHERVDVSTHPDADGRVIVIETPERFSEHCYVLTRR